MRYTEVFLHDLTLFLPARLQDGDAWRVVMVPGKGDCGYLVLNWLTLLKAHLESLNLFTNSFIPDRDKLKESGSESEVDLTRGRHVHEPSCSRSRSRDRHQQPGAVHATHKSVMAQAESSRGTRNEELSFALERATTVIIQDGQQGEDDEGVNVGIAHSRGQENPWNWTALDSQDHDWLKTHLTEAKTEAKHWKGKKTTRVFRFGAEYKQGLTTSIYTAYAVPAAAMGGGETDDLQFLCAGNCLAYIPQGSSTSIDAVVLFVCIGLLGGYKPLVLVAHESEGTAGVTLELLPLATLAKRSAKIVPRSLATEPTFPELVQLGLGNLDSVFQERFGNGAGGLGLIPDNPELPGAPTDPVLSTPGRSSSHRRSTRSAHRSPSTASAATQPYSSPPATPESSTGQHLHPETPIQIEHPVPPAKSSSSSGKKKDQKDKQKDNRIKNLENEIAELRELLPKRGKQCERVTCKANRAKVKDIESDKQEIASLKRKLTDTQRDLENKVGELDAFAQNYICPECPSGTKKARIAKALAELAATPSRSQLIEELAGSAAQIAKSDAELDLARKTIKKLQDELKAQPVALPPGTFRAEDLEKLGKFGQLFNPFSSALSTATSISISSAPTTKQAEEPR